jgi:hypothetical protein
MIWAMCRSKIKSRLSGAAKFVKPDGETMLHFLVFLFCFLISFGDIFVAHNIQDDPSQAGRGGALACAISFFSLFINRSYGLEVFRLRVVTMPNMIDRIAKLRGISAEKDLGKRIDLLITAIIEMIEVDLLGQKKQNFFIALSAGIGTIFWGFGDWFTDLLFPPRPVTLIVQPIHLCLLKGLNGISHQIIAPCH